MTRLSLPKLFVLAGAILALLAAYLGIRNRSDAFETLRATTETRAVRTVALIRPDHSPDMQEIVLPGSVQARNETPIYARTNGYLKRWHTDIGTVVKAGQLLAEIDAPEIDAQLRQAEADLAAAKVASLLARNTAKRWQAMVRTSSVSMQATDEKIADAAAKEANVAAAAANVERLRQQQSFKRVTAPFDGIITARTTDIGALITAGSAGQKELFRLTDGSRLRIHVQVPQIYGGALKPGTEVELRFAEFPGRAFKASLVRTAGALDPSARTLLVELQADNPRGEMLPGGYAEVHFKISSTRNTLTLPASALLFRAEGPRVATVTAEGRVVLQPVALGRDFGKTVEILTGLPPDGAVIDNPPDGLADNEPVRIVQPRAS